MITFFAGVVVGGFTCLGALVVLFAVCALKPIEDEPWRRPQPNGGK